MVAYLDIESSPTGAKVYISGNYIGKTPINDHKLWEGNYNIKIEKEGYISYQHLNYRIKSTDLAKTIDVTLRKEEEEWGELKVKSDPSGAKVYVNNRYVGETPYTNKVMAPGRHDVDIELKGYEDESKRVTIESGETKTIDINLEKIELVEKTWLEKFLEKLLISPLTAFNFFSPLSNTIKNNILLTLLKSADGEEKLEKFGEYMGERFITEYPKYKILKGAPKRSLSILAILGLVGAVLGFGTLVNWLRKELPEPSGMAVWAAIEAKDWETAREANEQYKKFIDVANSWYALVLGFLNPFIWAFMNKNKESQLTGYKTYKTLIDKELGEFELPEIIRTHVRDIIDGDTIDTSLNIIDSEEKLPEYGTTGHARIRIVGINSPEKSPKGEILCTDIEIYQVQKSWADASRDALLPLNDKEVTLYIDPEKKTDTFGRILAVIKRNDVDIALEQIKKGLACWYFRETNKYVDDEIYKAATLKAQEDKTGMWSDLPEQPGLPPEAKITFSIDSNPSNAPVFIDGIATHHNTPTDNTEQADVWELWTEGKHILKITKSGMVQEKEITLIPGEHLELVVDLTALPPPEELPPKELPPEEPLEEPPVTPPPEKPEEKDKMIEDLQNTISELNKTIIALNVTISELEGIPPTPPPEEPPVMHPVIPLIYSADQLWALTTAFSELWDFIKGATQLSTAEYEVFKTSYDLYTTEQKKVLNIFFNKVWELTKGAAQMSHKEYDNLKEEFHI